MIARARSAVSTVAVLAFLGLVLQVPRAALAEASRWRQIGPFGGAAVAMKIAPSQPSVVYASALDAGVFRSADGGRSWSSVGSVTANVNALSVSPTDPAIVLAASDQGILRTTNAGRSWEPVGPQGSIVHDVLFDPSDPLRAYAAAEGAFLRSNDGGRTWAETPGVGTFYRLAIDPARPGGLYAGGQNVWRSSDGGITWHEKRHLSDNFPDSFGTSAADPKVVYVGLDDGLLRSDDEGRTWTKAAEGLPRRPWVAALAVDPRDAAVAFAAVISDGRTVSVGVYRTTDGGVTWHPRMDGLPTGWSGVPVLQMDPAHSEKLLTSLGGSIFRSTNTGGTWTLSARGFAALQVNQVTIDPFDAAQVMVSTEEGLFRSRDAGADFGMVGGGISPFGRATSMVFDPVDPRIQYVASSRTVYRSVDRGATWGATSGKGEGLLIDRADPRVLYIDGRYRTSDRGRSWQATSLDPDGSQPIYSQAESPTDPAVVLVGLGMDGIFLTEDGGASFRSVDSPAATSIVFSPDHPRTVIAGARCPEHPCRGNEAGGVRVSHDGGHTWAWINDGLPDQAEVTAAAIDPAYPGVMYAAVQGHGVWRSPNGGQLWLPFGDDMPADTYILGLTVDPTGRRLYAATLRRSAFVVSLPPTG